MTSGSPAGEGSDPPPNGRGSDPPPNGRGSDPPPNGRGSDPPPNGRGSDPPPMNATISMWSPSATGASPQVRRGITSRFFSTATREGSTPMAASKLATVVPRGV